MGVEEDKAKHVHKHQSWGCHEYLTSMPQRQPNGHTIWFGSVFDIDSDVKLAAAQAEKDKVADKYARALHSLTDIDLWFLYKLDRIESLSKVLEAYSLDTLPATSSTILSTGS